MLPRQKTLSGVTQDEIRARCEEGIAACRRGDWESGVDALYTVVMPAWLGDEVPSLAYSYLGYGLAATGASYKEGLRLCRLSVQRDAFEPENYLNLARTCQLRGRRKMTVRALNRGLRISPRHPGLRSLRDQLGRRKRPVVPMLSRAHPLNRFLGKLRYELTK